MAGIFPILGIIGVADLMIDACVTVSPRAERIGHNCLVPNAEIPETDTRGRSLVLIPFFILYIAGATEMPELPAA
jgi:hypothetical protein